MAFISGANLGMALASYIESEIVPLYSGYEKVMMCLAIPIALKKAPEMIQRYKGYLDLLGVLRKDGNIEYEGLHEALKDAVGKSGAFSIGAVTLDKDDIDKLFGIAKQYVQEG